MRVLEIGPNVKPQAQYIPGWKDAQIVTLDADPDQHPDIVADAQRLPAELEGQFDGVLASHVLEHFPWWDTANVLASWIGALKPGGELHILAPSLEWAAREILSERPLKNVIPHLYAGNVNQWDVHKAGFTMRYLRILFEQLGLAVTAARSGAYTIMVQGQPVKAEQHYIRGVKKEKGENHARTKTPPTTVSEIAVAATRQSAGSTAARATDQTTQQEV